MITGENDAVSEGKLQLQLQSDSPSLASFPEKGKTTGEKARSSESNIHTITITFQVNCQSCRSQVECVAKE